MTFSTFYIAEIGESKIGNTLVLYHCLISKDFDFIIHKKIARHGMLDSLKDVIN